MKTIEFGEVQDPALWGASATMKVGDPLTEEWLDRIRSLMTALNAARTAILLADEYLLAGEGVGLRYYFLDFKEAHTKFEQALADADVRLPSDEPTAG